MPLTVYRPLQHCNTFGQRQQKLIRILIQLKTEYDVRPSGNDSSTTTIHGLHNDYSNQPFSFYCLESRLIIGRNEFTRKTNISVIPKLVLNIVSV